MIDLNLLTTGHFGIWVLPQVSIQNSIADLITNLVCGEATSIKLKVQSTEIALFEFMIVLRSLNLFIWDMWDLWQESLKKEYTEALLL